MAEFNFKLSWAPGSKNPADAPSRRPDYVPQEGDSIKNVNFQTLLKLSHTGPVPSDSTLITPVPNSPIFPLPFPSILNAAALFTVDASAPIEEFRAALASDSSWREALERESANTRKRYKDWSQLEDFILYRNRIYVPPSLRPKILFEHHDSHLAGHPGRAKTIELIARDYSWPGLSNDIRHYVQSCDLCQ